MCNSKDIADEVFIRKNNPLGKTHGRRLVVLISALVKKQYILKTELCLISSTKCEKQYDASVKYDVS